MSALASTTRLSVQCESKSIQFAAMHVVSTRPEPLLRGGVCSELYTFPVLQCSSTNVCLICTTSGLSVPLK